MGWDESYDAWLEREEEHDRRAEARERRRMMAEPEQELRAIEDELIDLRTKVEAQVVKALAELKQACDDRIAAGERQFQAGLRELERIRFEGHHEAKESYVRGSVRIAAMKEVWLADLDARIEAELRQAAEEGKD